MAGARAPAAPEPPLDFPSIEATLFMLTSSMVTGRRHVQRRSSVPSAARAQA
jgi:hypothetical protein